MSLDHMNMKNTVQRLELNILIRPLISFVVFRATSVIFFFIVLANLTAFRNTKTIFINSYAFGHSIIDTSGFFQAYNKSGICLSIGHRKNRNKYFKYIYAPQVLIHFWLPYFKSFDLNHKLKTKVHLTILNILQNSWSLRIVIGRNIKCIERDSLLDEAVISELMSNYSYSEEASSNLVEKFKLDFRLAGSDHSSSINFLLQKIL